MKPVYDATSSLLRAIATRFPDQLLTMEEIRSRTWASATFTGARHELTFRVEGDGAGAAADAFLGTLDTAEFSLCGHILADVALVWEERRDGCDCITISIEALTVEDD